MTAVLVVDDSLTVRMDLEEAFAAAGFEPILAADVASARRALARQRRSRSSCSTCSSPTATGSSCSPRCERSPRHAGTPVVLLSTEAEVQHRVRGLQTGADEYVGKPYDAAHVVARARELVRRRAGFVDPGRRRPPGAGGRRQRHRPRGAAGGAGAGGVRGPDGGLGARRGCRLAAERLPRAVVVDGVMPGMDGATFIREIRADAALRTTPCILLTASGSVGELRALDAGADAYVRKDEDGNELVLARLQALLRVATSAPALARGRAARAEARPRRGRGGGAARGRRRAAPGRRARRGARRLGRGGAGAAGRRSRRRNRGRGDPRARPGRRGVPAPPRRRQVAPRTAPRPGREGGPRRDRGRARMGRRRLRAGGERPARGARARERAAAPQASSRTRTGRARDTRGARRSWRRSRTRSSRSGATGASCT